MVDGVKKYWFCERPEIMDEAAKAQRKFHPVLLVAIYLLLPGMINVLFGLSIPVLTDLFGHGNYHTVLQVLHNVIQLVPFALILFFVRFAEKRSWASMGILNNNVLKTYLIVLGIFFVMGGLSAFVRREGMQSVSLLMALQFATNVIASLCSTIIAYGFFTISLANRMSMKNAVLVVALLPLVGHVLNLMDAAFFPHIYGTGIEDPSLASRVASISLSAVESTIFIAACALLLFRTGNIWSVAILALFEPWIVALGLTLDYPYHNIIMIILSAAVLCMVLFMPKKARNADNDLTEGAGFVSRQTTRS